MGESGAKEATTDPSTFFGAKSAPNFSQDTDLWVMKICRVVRRNHAEKRRPASRGEERAGFVWDWI
jgi:hypothetical protein